MLSVFFLVADKHLLSVKAKLELFSPGLLKLQVVLTTLHFGADLHVRCLFNHSLWGGYSCPSPTPGTGILSLYAAGIFIRLSNQGAAEQHPLRSRGPVTALLYYSILFVLQPDAV